MLRPYRVPPEDVDELAACGLLLPYGLALNPLEALGEGVCHLLHGGQDAVRRCGAGRAGRACGGQMGADQGPRSVAGVSRLVPERPA